jgi:hypothetical protein
VRSSLVTALVSCADGSFKSKSRRFLAGLSYDELQFIAEYLGACILDSSGECFRSRAELARRIAQFEQGRGTGGRIRSEDLEHKMILLLEYLWRSGRPEFSARVRTV